MTGACPRCTDGTCKQCKQLLRCFRLAVRRAMLQPGFAARMRAVGQEESGGRVMAGGLPADIGAERVLMSVARAVQAERKAGE